MNTNPARDKFYQAVSATPIKKYERDRLHRSFNYQSYVVSYAINAAMYGFFIGSGGIVAFLTLQGLMVGESYPFIAVFIAAFTTGVTASGFIGLVALFASKRDFSDLMTEYEGATFEAPERENNQALVLRNGIPEAKTRRDKTIETRDGHKFTFKGRNLDKLLAWLEDGQDTIRKQSSPVGQGFDRLPIPITSTRYTTALYVLRGGGYVDDQNKWTERGVEFLKEM